MNMVTRYEMTEGFYGAVDFTAVSESYAGRFVSYEDYKNLEQKVVALLDNIKERYPGEDFKCPLIVKLADAVEYKSK